MWDRQTCSTQHLNPNFDPDSEQNSQTAGKTLWAYDDANHTKFGC